MSWEIRRWWPFGRGASNGVVPKSSKKRAATVIRAHAPPEPRGLAALVEDVDSDYQFRLGVLTISALVQSATVSIEVDGDSRAAALADNLQLRWKESLPLALKAIGYGRTCFEKWYRYDRVSGLQLLGGLDYLAFEMTEMVLDSHTGEFVTVRVRPRDQPMIELPRGHVWWFAIDATPQEPHGRSRYLGAVQHVRRHRRALDDNEDKFLRKFALGHGVGKAPSQYPPTTFAGKGTSGEIDSSGQPLNPIQDMAAWIRELQSGGVMVLPSEVDPAGGGPLFDYSPPSNASLNAAPLENRRRVLDAAALRALGVPERAVTQDEGTGSYGMAEAHRQVLANTVEGILSQIVASFQRDVIDEAIAINWPPTSSPRLTMVWQPINDARKSEVIKLVQSIVQAPALSPLVVGGVIDLAKLLEIADMPAGEDIGQRLDKLNRSSGLSGLGAMIPDVGNSPAVPVAAAKEKLPADDVAATALNGAQIASLVEIVQQAASGQLPLASAKPILEAAFPMLPTAVLDRIVRPVASFTPAAGSAAGGQAPAGVQLSLDSPFVEPPEGMASWEEYFMRAQAEAEAVYAKVRDELASRDVDRRRLRPSPSGAGPPTV